MSQLDETLFRSAFLAATRWLYLDTIEYVKDQKKPFEARLDESFISDVNIMRAAYRRINP